MHGAADEDVCSEGIRTAGGPARPTSPEPLKSSSEVVFVEVVEVFQCW